MTTVNAELYVALLAAGAPEAKARAAAEGVASIATRLSLLERHSFENAGTFDRRSTAADGRFASLRDDLNLLKWMVGFVLAGVATLVVRGLF